MNTNTNSPQSWSKPAHQTPAQQAWIHANLDHLAGPSHGASHHLSTTNPEDIRLKGILALLHGHGHGTAALAQANPKVLMSDEAWDN